MRTLLSSILLSLLLALSGSALAAGGSFFDQTFDNFSEELKAAQAQGKDGIMLFFEMDECPFCQRMKTTVFNRPKVREYYGKHFLVFPVDIEGDTEITDFQGRSMPAKDYAFKINRVRATPVIAFYDLQGRQVAKYTGATKDAQEFLWLGEYVVSGAYRHTSFTRYKRERAARKPG